MDYVAWAAGGLVLLVGMFALGYGARRWWIAALPFALPALFGVWGGVGAVTENRDECYEACGYVWLLVFGVVSLAPAAAGAIAGAVGVWVGRRRRGGPTPSAGGTASASSRPTSGRSSAAVG